MKELKDMCEWLQDDILNIVDKKLGEAPQLEIDAQEHLKKIESLVNGAITEKTMRDNLSIKPTGVKSTPSSPPLIEQPASLEEWKDKAEKLWCLLDDIDTAIDMFKPDLTPYVRYVDKKHKLRFEHMESDGYKVINVIKPSN